MKRRDFGPATRLSKGFPEGPPEETVHIIVLRPPQVRAPVPSRALTPLPGSLSDSYRPDIPLSGDLHADIKRITDKFFAPGPIANFLDAFVRGKGTLPVTHGPIRGLSRAWRRNMGEAPQTRPSLLFLDLPDPAVPDLATKNFAAGSIFDKVKGNNRPHMPGKQASSIVVDLEANNAFARKTTLLSFLSRLLVFKYCLSVPGSGETFTSARWTLLQVCPHVLFQDIFGEFFVKLLELRHHRELDLSDVVRNVYDGAKGRLVEHECLPKIKDNTRLLVINDEAQFLGDQSKGSFKSASDSDDSLRQLLSPILHAFRQEKIVEHSEHSTWRTLIDDTEDKLVDWEHRTIKGNLCGDLDRLHQKHNDACRDKENYLNATDLGFQTDLRSLMDRTNAAAQGNIFERHMMTVFSETFKSQPLSDWPHQPPISEMCPDLVGEVEIVGWKDPGLLQGNTHAMMSMGEFMDAHVNNHSTRNNIPVAPFFFPKIKPSGPDMVFFIRINGRKLVPVFVQTKLHQSSASLNKRAWNAALATVSASCIQDHIKDFRNFCPDNIYISMVVAYPMRCSSTLPPVKVPKIEANGVQQIVIRVGDTNFGQIFPKEHVKFIDRLKNTGKRVADDSDNDDDGRVKSKGLTHDSSCPSIKVAHFWILVMSKSKMSTLEMPSCSRLLIAPATLFSLPRERVKRTLSG
ncbi:hypothetical protein B0O80DRAFT_490033 [Mortierella sp. GBAus27b]|nr:hypothetical protein B0O80DRAFT_490033 [Mortierella sp. GBAus27b]